MRHVTFVLALVLTLALAVPATVAASCQPEDPILEALESQPSIGPYLGSNG